MKKTIVTAALIVAATVPPLYAQVQRDKCYIFENTSVPYGHYHHGADKGPYGRRAEVLDRMQAAVIVKGFYTTRPVSIGEIKERRRFFIIEVLDPAHNVIDVVIVDKRSGRARSIY